MQSIKKLITFNKYLSARISVLATMGALASVTATHSFAHGYLEGERGDLCRQNINANCSNVDPADTEHPGTFPAGGPPDGQLGSATRPYPQLDEQSATRWYKHGMSSGSNDFHWIIPAQHVSDNYRYYITKPDWNPNVPLARSAFDLTPFCEVEDNGRAPGNPTHNCNVPQRSGYHIILAIWQVSYTGAEFYSLLDANFNGDSQPGDGSSSSAGSSNGTTQCNSSAWSATAIYQYGDTVAHNGNQWVARWYAEGQEPGTTGDFGVWENNGSCQ